MKNLNKEVVYVTIGDFYPNVNEKLEVNKMSINELDLCDIFDENIRNNKNSLIIAEVGLKQKLLNPTLQFAFGVY